MTAWQPMETAPKDGTPVLVLFNLPDGGHAYHVVWWYAGGNPYYSWRSGGRYDEIFATHSAVYWQNLPAPPPISGAGQNEEVGK